jgi:hypothetical protein
LESSGGLGSGTEQMVAVVGQVKTKSTGMDPDGRASSLALSFGSTQLREKLRSRTAIPSRWRAVGAPSLCLEPDVSIGFESVHYRILYAGR